MFILALLVWRVNERLQATPSLTYRHLTSFAVRGVVDISRNRFVVWDEFYSEEGKNGLKENPHFEQLTTTFFNLAHISLERVIRSQNDLDLSQSYSSFSELVQIRPPSLIILGLGPNGNIGWITTPSLNQGVHTLSISDATDQQNAGMYKLAFVTGLQCNVSVRIVIWVFI